MARSHGILVTEPRPPRRNRTVASRNWQKTAMPPLRTPSANPGTTWYAWNGPTDGAKAPSGGSGSRWGNSGNPDEDGKGAPQSNCGLTFLLSTEAGWPRRGSIGFSSLNGGAPSVYNDLRLVRERGV